MGPLVRARQALDDNQYTQALVLLNDIHDNQLKTSEYYTIKGLSYLKLGDLRRALKAYKKVSPQPLSTKIEIAYLYLLLGETGRVEKLVDKMESAFGQSPETALLRGNINLKKELFDDAEKYYRAALKQDENFIKGYVGLANSFLKQRDFKKAEEYYLEAVRRSKEGTVADIALANFYLSTDRSREAEIHLEGKLKTYPDDINLSMALSTVYIKRNNLSGANEIYLNALKHHPDSLALIIRAIKTNLDLGKNLAASRLIEKLNQAGLDEDKKNERYYGAMLLGEYHLRAGDVDSALSSFNKALVVSPSSYEINYYLGLTHLLQNKPRLSKQFLKKAIQNNPGYIQAHLLLAGLYLLSNQYDLAADHAKLVLQIEPDNRSGHAMNGVALYLQSRLEEARYEFEVLQKLDSRNNLYFYFNALTAINNKQLSEARKQISEIDPRYVERLFLELELLKQEKVEPRQVDDHLAPYLDHQAGFLSHALMGQYYLEEGVLGLADKHLEKAILLNHNNTAAHYMKAKIASEKGDAASAMTLLNRLIEMHPQFIKSYQALGILYEKNKDYIHARKVYEKGLAYFPEDDMLLNNLAWILLNHFEDKTTAYSYIRQAISVAPKNDQINDTLGWWYYLNGDYQQAIEILDPLVNKNPDKGLYKYHLGMAYVKNEEMHLGLPHLETALKQDIPDNLKAKISKILKMINL